MNMKRRILGLLVTTGIVLGGCTSSPADTPAAQPAPAAAAPGYTPVVSLNELMVYVIDPHSNELWDAAKTPPTSDAGWKALLRSAVAVAAAGSLTGSGNGPDDQKWTQQADWSKYSQEVADAGMAALTAVRAQDARALSKAGDQLVLACVNCHREYKLNMPAIWTERQLPPEEQKRP